MGRRRDLASAEEQETLVARVGHRVDRLGQHGGGAGEQERQELRDRDAGVGQERRDDRLGAAFGGHGRQATEPSVVDETDAEVLRGVPAVQHQRRVARHLGVGLGGHDLDAYAVLGGRGLEPATVLADDLVVGAVVEDQQERTRLRATLGEGSSKTSRGRTASMRGNRCSASPAIADGPTRCGSTPRPGARLVPPGTSRPTRAGVGVGERDREHLRRVDREVAVGRAGDGDVVEGGATSPWSARGPSPTWSRYSSTTTAVASWSRVTVGTIVDHRPSAWSATSEPAGEATTTWHPRRTASATVPAVARSEPSGARTTTRSSPPAQPGSAGPGQATKGTGHHGSSTARSRRESGTGGHDRPRSGRVTGGGDRRGDTVRGFRGLAAYARAGLGEHAEPYVGALQCRLVVQPGLVEPDGHGTSGPQAGRRASSTSRTGMSSRTG